MILHQSGFWFTVFLTEMQRTRVAMAKFEFHVHKAEVENVKSFDYNGRSNVMEDGNLKMHG